MSGHRREDKMRLTMYGKKPLLSRIFTSKRGYILLPSGVSLEGIDLGEEEV